MPESLDRDRCGRVLDGCPFENCEQDRHRYSEPDQAHDTAQPPRLSERKSEARDDQARGDRQGDRAISLRPGQLMARS